MFLWTINHILRPWFPNREPSKGVGEQWWAERKLYTFPFHPQLNQNNSTYIGFAWCFIIWAFVQYFIWRKTSTTQKHFKELKKKKHYSRANTGLFFLIDSEDFLFRKGFISPQVRLDDFDKRKQSTDFPMTKWGQLFHSVSRVNLWIFTEAWEQEWPWPLFSLTSLLYKWENQIQRG